MMNTIDLSWLPSAIRTPDFRVVDNTSIYHSTCVHANKKLLWEAPVSPPKVAMYSQPRYTRSVPAWELQAPENCFNLSTLLQVLEEVDESCVLTVRKIHKIGLNSACLLREHFSQFGEVDRVLLLPSRPKSTGVAHKVRPASMAFVVMRSRQPAIIARLHEIHSIDGSQVQVQKFKRDPTDADFMTADNYSWLDDASTVADRSPPVARGAAKMIN